MSEITERGATGQNVKDAISNIATPANGATIPDPEGSGLPRRRRFTGPYKLEVLRQADACKEAGEVGALLRREGLYSSHLSEWRKLREKGALSSLEKRLPRSPIWSVRLGSIKPSSTARRNVVA